MKLGGSLEEVKPGALGGGLKEVKPGALAGGEASKFWAWGPILGFRGQMWAWQPICQFVGFVGFGTNFGLWRPFWGQFFAILGCGILSFGAFGWGLGANFGLWGPILGFRSQFWALEANFEWFGSQFWALRDSFWLWKLILGFGSQF